jgi:hypothetical protein
MTLFNPFYRLTLFQPHSVDPTETTVLSASGTDFKVTTVPAHRLAALSMTAWYPYLDEVTEGGRSGRLDPLTRTVDVGTFELTLIDIRTGSTNTARWVTQFLGNAAGANQFNGLKGKLEESVDDGATWADFETGRIITTSLDDQYPGTKFVMRFRDMGADLDADVFVGRPHASATGPGEMQIIPVGLADPYGDFDTQTLLSGTIKASTAGTGKVLELSSSAQASVRNFIDDSLRQEGVTFNNPVNPRYTDSVRVYIVRGDTGATGELRLGEVETVAGGALGGFHGAVKVTKKVVDALPAIAVTSITRASSTATVTTTADHHWTTGMVITHAGANQADYNIAAAITVTGATTYTYAVGGAPATPATGTITASEYQNYIPLPPNGTAVTFALRRVSSPPTEETPLFIDDVNRITYLSDLLAGYYGYLTTDGRVKRSYAKHASSFSSFTSDASIPTVRKRVKKVTKLFEEIAQTCLEGGLGYFMNASGEVELFDMRFPNATVSPGTITDADLIEEPKWEQAREESIPRLTVLYYEDVEVAISSDQAPQVGGAVGWLGVNTTALMEVQHKVIDFDFGNQDTGGRAVTIDATGFRQAAGETVVSGTNGTMDREPYIYGLAASLGVELRKPYGNGPQRVRLVCRRTATVTALSIGAWVLSSVSKVPDAATSTRGQSRLYRVLETSYHGPAISLLLLDSGPNAVASSPTVGALGAGVDAFHQITIPLTPNAAGDPIIVRVATTDTATTTAPADNSGAWHIITLDGLRTPRVLHAGTYTASNLPSGQNIHVQARSEPAPLTDAKLPSAWAVSTGTDYRATTALSAPSSVANADDTPTTTDTLTLTWTNGSANTPTEIQLVYVSGVGSSVTTIPILPAGSTSFILNNWVTPNTTYTPRVRHTDLLGGVSAWVNASGNLVVPAFFVGPSVGGVGTLVLTEFA